MAVGKPQQQHKKQAGKAPPAVATADLDLQLQEEEDLLKGIDMTLLHRSASFHSLYFIYFCAKIVTCYCDPYLQRRCTNIVTLEVVEGSVRRHDLTEPLGAEGYSVVTIQCLCL